MGKVKIARRKVCTALRSVRVVCSLLGGLGEWGEVGGVGRMGGGGVGSGDGEEGSGLTVWETSI